MQKEITIYDIADKLGISATTVSRGLNDNPRINKKTREKIHATAKEMGYQHNTLASNLRKQQTKTIGILLHEVNSNFITSVLAGIEKVLAKEHYDILITHSAESGEKEIANAKNLLNKRVDGLIVSLALSSKNIDHFTPYFERKIPVVFFDRIIPEADCTKVVIDNFNCGYNATAHLIAQGCKKIAHITADLARNVYNDRFLGYKKALKNNKITFKKELVKVCNLDKAETIAATNELLKQKPDAFFITSDFAAAVCIEVLHEHNLRVPKDIAVFGFNNDTLGDLITPKLSTIDYPGILMGEVAAEELMKKIKLKKNNKKLIDQTITIPSEIIIRQSSLKKDYKKYQ
ncbi:LacI family DNA-binding transcriptional regulator [Arachidicoccus sp.]|uniref:LacI family DNA-binding transcriptional regulator n=1 Tax=Arachidicoccus sp. TaxID=1872624 RepID=UPI003D20319A